MTRRIIVKNVKFLFVGMEKDNDLQQFKITYKIMEKTCFLAVRIVLLF